MVLTLAVALATFWAGYDGGTYSPTSRTTFAIGVAWTVVVGILAGILPLGSRARAALVPAAFLAAFAAWTALSAAWAVSAEGVFAEFNRATLYLGVFGLAALAASRTSAPRIADGLGIGIAAVGLLALAARLFPGLVDQAELKTYLPAAFTRLSYPVDYWNGLAVLIALGLPLLLRAAAAEGSPLVRGAALTPVPALVGAAYMTSSRGGVAAAVVGILALLVLAARRWQLFEGLAVAGAGSALSVLVLHARPALVDPPLRGGVPAGDGRIAALLIALVCLATGIAYGARLLLAPPARVPVVVGRLVVILVAVALLFGLILSHPVRHFEAFKRAPSTELSTTTDYVQSHLFSANGSGRWQFWGTALREFESKPVEGRGAGAFEAWWSRHGTLSFFVRDAHSLYLETLGDLGIVGFIFLVGALLFALALGFDGLVRGPPEERDVRAALLAAAIAFLVAAGIDWMWELTVVALVAFTCLGLSAGLGTGRTDSSNRRRRLGLWPAAPLVLAALALAAGQAIALVAVTRLDASQRAAERGDTGAALAAARSARDVEPWAASPYLQLALIQERSGALASAERQISRAIHRNAEDWRLWLTAARIQTKQGEVVEARRSLTRARELNPRSPILRP